MIEPPEHNSLEWRVAMIEQYLESELGRGGKTEGNLKRQLKTKLDNNAEHEALQDKRLDRLNDLVYGNGKMGLSTMVKIMWHTHIWILITGATLLGTLGGWLLKTFTMD